MLKFQAVVKKTAKRL